MNHPDRINTPSFLHNLLMEPKYRMVRHFLLILVMVVTALNQSFMTLKDGIEVLGYRIFIQAFFLFMTYVLVCYFNLWVLLPRYLLKKRYVRYTACLSAAIFLLVLVQTLEERTVLLHLGMLNDFYLFPRAFFTVISSFALLLLCISGAAMTVLLKHWMTDFQKVNQLEKLHLQSEVEQLKEQVSPHLLFSILNRTGVLAKLHPERASDMLLKLSQVLRYQLYDCNRDRVLLTSEIKFLNHYLTLEQMYSGLFELNIRSDKGCSHVLVSPLLFISFVQTAVRRIRELDKATTLELIFQTAEDDSVTFTCRGGLKTLFSAADFSKVSRRLTILYQNHHSLTVTNQEVILTLTLSSAS